MKDNFKANNKCKRCHRELKDDNAQYGWRCAEIMGLSSNNSLIRVEISFCLKPD